MSNTPWRYRCPNGHSSWRSRNDGTYECKTCGVEFDELVDVVERPDKLNPDADA